MEKIRTFGEYFDEAKKLHADGKYTEAGWEAMCALDVAGNNTEKGEASALRGWIYKDHGDATEEKIYVNLLNKKIEITSQERKKFMYWLAEKDWRAILDEYKVDGGIKDSAVMGLTALGIDVSQYTLEGKGS